MAAKQTSEESATEKLNEARKRNLDLAISHIQKEFGEVFDLRFYMVEENLSRLRAMLPGTDYVWTFTSKISHKVEETMKSAGCTIHRCSGGMTMLKEQLLNLYVSLEGKTHE